ncbi:hypothetical protein FM113_11570 [Leucobacter sp. 7(1)]|uniref:CehA/McbA family metallohydrolase n=1 Tax=Leucobacter sp. 7(1) TaxID=1255613 RepID=UPI00097EAF3F|nr:CehA/McbA family metallohydrolase [Leucobacter sp. 7(1)]SJN11288.1 hypothetical protein FM113_11570 [Leucobacter sp. 7(1)]
MTTHSPAGYFPVDLTHAYNAPVDLFEDPQDVTLGQRVLHGLPFSFGTAQHAVVRATPGAHVDMNVEGIATSLVFAHAVLETDLYSGGSIGEHVGAYLVTYADGSEVEISLSQRFEIGPTPRKWLGHVTPLDWGQTPFLAVNDAEHELMERVCGRFDTAGARLVEIEDPQSRVPYLLPYRFYLWAWQNPHPELAIARVRLSGGEKHTLLLGAITRSTLAEEPLNRAVEREMLIQLTGVEMDETVEVAVDRGTAQYVYRTHRTPDKVRTGVFGWGSAHSEPGSGYVRVAAAPSATIMIMRADAVLAEFIWGDLVAADTLRLTEQVSVALPSADRSWVRGSIRDADTGQPVAARVRFESADGIPYAPYGHHAHINSDGSTWNLDIGGDVRLGASTYAFADGRFEGWLPNGEITVEVVRGFTYEPFRGSITVSAEQTSFDIQLTRRFNPLERGYVGGDTHVHFVSTKGAELEARAEDVQIVNLLQTQWGQLFTSTEEFSGRPEYSLEREAVVFTGQENRTNMLGHINLLGLSEPIMPWCTGGSEEAELGGGLETTLSHWADECHAQGGTVVLAHFPVPYGETAALLATGRLDAVESIGFDHYNMGEYYKYLNAGFQIPIAAGTDKMTAEVPIGMLRTYAGVPSKTPDYWEWCQGIKNGDTMITSGPLLWVTVDGAAPGQTLTRSRGNRITVAGELETIFPVTEVEVLLNGVVQARIPVAAQGGTASFAHDLEVTEDSWVAVRCFGANDARHHDTWDRVVFAHTSPVYVTTQGEYQRFNEHTIKNMLRIVDGARRYVVERGRTQWAGSVTHRHTHPDHEAFLVAPLDEATRTLTELIRTHTS